MMNKSNNIFLDSENEFSKNVYTLIDYLNLADSAIEQIDLTAARNYILFAKSKIEQNFKPTELNWIKTLELKQALSWWITSLVVLVTPQPLDLVICQKGIETIILLDNVFKKRKL